MVLALTNPLPVATLSSADYARPQHSTPDESISHTLPPLPFPPHHPNTQTTGNIRKRGYSLIACATAPFRGPPLRPFVSAPSVACQGSAGEAAFRPLTLACFLASTVLGGVIGGQNPSTILNLNSRLRLNQLCVICMAAARQASRQASHASLLGD